MPSKRQYGLVRVMFSAQLDRLTLLSYSSHRIALVSYRHIRKTWLTIDWSPYIPIYTSIKLNFKPRVTAEQAYTYKSSDKTD